MEEFILGAMDGAVKRGEGVEVRELARKSRAFGEVLAGSGWKITIVSVVSLVF